MDTWIFASTLIKLFSIVTMNVASVATNPTLPSSTPPASKPHQIIVYTAETARNSQAILPSASPVESSARAKEPENLGFVNPKEFESRLSRIDFLKSDEIFPEFFSSNSQSTPPSHKYSSDIERDPYGLLTSSASNYNTRKHDAGNEDGIVDPNIQFRSLFDAAETDASFTPHDFSNYNAENSRPDVSKSSQTRAYPSYTYTGRHEDDESDDDRAPSNFPPSQPPKYRSSYRQVNGRNHEGQSGQNDDYDSDQNNSPRREYYNGGNNPNYFNKPNDNRQQYVNNNPSSQETADAPEASAPPSKGVSKGGDSPSGKSKCKKVVKEVDDEEEYNYSPDDYDSSSYQSRYKRQAGNNRGRQRGVKRPMTCFVCEDDDGRYAEKCSYNSNSDPNKKGDYFHSTSTSFNDNGKPRGRRERHKRDPETLDSSPTFLKLGDSPTESLPKRIQKRQSQGNRYASDFQEEDGRDATGERLSPNSYRAGLASGSQPGHFDYTPSISLDVGRNGIREGQNTNPNRILEVEYGPTYGRDTQNSATGGFDFDFSIPKDFQQDIEHSGTTNAENRPGYSGGEITGFGKDFDIGYDDYVRKHFPEAFGSSQSGLPENEREPSGGSAPPSKTSPSYHHRNPPSVPSRPYGGESYGRGPSNFGTSSHGPSSYGPTGPNKEFTPQFPYFSTPEYYGPKGTGPQHLEQAINQFNQKDRKDCGKVQRGDMTCYVCRDPRGMNKEECMYDSNPNDPRNRQMAYHEVSEYSSQPAQNVQHSPPKNTYGQGQEEESKKVEKVTKAPVDYDFDY